MVSVFRSRRWSFRLPVGPSSRMRPPEIRCLSGLINLGHLCDFSWSLDRRLSALRGILRWLKKLNHRRRPEGNNGRADEFLTSHAAAGSSVLAVATVSSNRSDHRITVSCRRSASADAKTRLCFGRRWTPTQSGRRVEPPRGLAEEDDAKIPEITGVRRSSTRPQSPFHGMLTRIATAQGCGVGSRSPPAVASIIPR